MNTEDLRALTRAALLPRGTLWPNGLGFNCWGWEYTYSELLNQWYAVYRCANAERGRYCGNGPTPIDARADARKKGRIL